jgi:hypothetical protein
MNMSLLRYSAIVALAVAVVEQNLCGNVYGLHAK